MTSPDTTPNAVTEIPAAPSSAALSHFSSLLEFETDCWDTNAAMATGTPGFVLLDVRGKGGFDAGHVPGAVHFPHLELLEENLVDYPQDTLFVVYCAGPHCNGADKAGVALAKLGRPVKKMIGGVEGWNDEGFDFVTS